MLEFLCVIEAEPAPQPVAPPATALVDDAVKQVEKAINIIDMHNKDKEKET
jgi:hypothetical protein